MDDYSGLAARVAAGVGGLRGCLILSRDGLVLGAHPGDDETVAKPSWLRFAMLGEPDRSFVEFADQVWVYVHRGPYAAFAVADAGIRPGLVIDQLEQALLMAEESRTKREGLRAPEGAAAAAGPRTTLHPTPASTPSPIVVPVAVETAAPPADRPAPTRGPATPLEGQGGFGGPGAAAPDPEPGTESPGTAPATPERPAAPTERPTGAERPDRPPAGTPGDGEPEGPKHEAPKLMTTPVTPKRGPADDEEEGEVDRVLLAQEFSGLLQDLGTDDEADS
jgi:hypothetical protein